MTESSFRRVVSWLSVALLLMQVLLVLVSWLLSATMVQDVRSLLSAEGLRWYAGHFSHLLLSPVLSWLLLLAMSWGSVSASGLLAFRLSSATYRERFALRAALFLLMAYIGVVLLLVAVPHALLLSSTGSLCPSPFTAALVPIVSFGAVLVSVVYGFVSSHFVTYHDVVTALVGGLASSAPVLFLYILATQFVQSLLYAFFT